MQGKKFELLRNMADAMKQVLDRVTVTSFEMCMKFETALLSVVFDNSKPGMVAEVPEELKLSVMRCLTTLMLRLDQHCRMTMLKTQVPTIAQAVFVAVHIAKLDKLRQLRLSALECLMAHTCSHPKITNEKGHITEKHLELLVVDTLSNILPGVLAALQDVATDVNNPGHVVVVSALQATHRILCLAMHDKHKPRAPDLTPGDFAKLMIERALQDRQVSKERKPKFLAKRSLEWYAMAGEKLTVVTQSLAALAAHHHARVRRELANLCCRILDECNSTMQPSLPIALDVLITLSKDDFPEVAEFCQNAVNNYMNNNKEKNNTVDGLVDNFFNLLMSLPRILNNIDAGRKLSSLNLLHGYISILCDSSRPQRLTTAVSQHRHMSCCCDALLAAAASSPLASLALHATRDVLAPPPTTSPWCRLRHLDTPACEARLRDILRLLGNAECAELMADRLLELFHQERTSEIVYVINWMASGEKEIVVSYFLEE
ncbi:hypothetical protein O0L34_g17418 [Tuta absoluta]|nr:hypothetical protein O0L34_g17418 [Tuta absoluta]